MADGSALNFKRMVHIVTAVDAVRDGLMESRVVPFAELDETFGKRQVVRSLGGMIRHMKKEIDSGTFDGIRNDLAEDMLYYAHFYLAEKGFKRAAFSVGALAYDIEKSGPCRLFDERVAKDKKRHELWAYYAPTRRNKTHRTAPVQSTVLQAA
jgi:hypothetical protein